MRQRGVAVVLAVVFGILLAGRPGPVGADTGGGDRLSAVNVVPPGESGLVTASAFAQAQSGVGDGSYGPHVQDQLPLFAGFRYKPFQFEPQLATTPVPGGAGVRLGRNPFGVPVLAAASDDDLFYGIGYAMAQDRLFQMELFRRVGHGTLAQLLGPGRLDMDEAVRRASEGKPGRDAELAAQPASVRSRLHQFTGGVNTAMAEAMADPSKLPVELGLLNDLPLPPWTDDDTLAFGEYAGRFFGQFGGTQLLAAHLYADLVQARGAAYAETAFNDLFPRNDPTAPASIDPRDGTFPRHTAPAAVGTAPASSYVNHDVAVSGPSIAAVDNAVAHRAAAVRQTQREVGIPLFGSNEIIVSGSRTQDHNPMLYGGPQTGFSVPGYFWEVELHSPGRDERGVMVPAIPLIVIGRNADAAWTVTSGLDDNQDVFVETLDSSNMSYVHNGTQLAVTSHSETIACNLPPTAATALIGGVRGGNPAPPQTCPVGGRTITVSRTVHGGALVDATGDHRLFVSQSVVDGRLLQSLAAWDAVGLQHDAHSFLAALAPMALCFNFTWVDAHGDTAFDHVGRIPLRPANIDGNLPASGTGADDWQGMENYADQPHVINPVQGYLVNWNNKPSVGWWSPATSQESGAPNIWSTEHQVVRLGSEVAAAPPLTLTAFSQLAKAPAYVDNPARILRPAVLAALAQSTDATTVHVAQLLAAWDLSRTATADGTAYTTPAVTIFDTLMDHLLVDIPGTLLGATDAHILVGLAPGCSGSACHLVSLDNLDAPTMKWELVADHLVLNSLTGRTQAGWLGTGDAAGAIRTAVAEAVAELSTTFGSSDPTTWSESVEHGVFSGLGAASVPDLVPLPNRGSYGQAVEALVASPGTTPSQPGVTALANTTGVGGTGIAGVLAAGALGVLGCARRRRRGAGTGSHSG